MRCPSCGTENAPDSRFCGGCGARAPSQSRTRVSQGQEQRKRVACLEKLAEDIQGYLREQMPVWRDRHPGVEEMRVAVMGCVVNGPGESKHANIGISLPGTFEEPKAPVYIDGKLAVTLRGEGIVPEFLTILEQYVAKTYPARATADVA